MIKEITYLKGYSYTLSEIGDIGNIWDKEKNFILNFVVKDVSINGEIDELKLIQFCHIQSCKMINNLYLTDKSRKLAKKLRDDTLYFYRDFFINDILT